MNNQVTRKPYRFVYAVLTLFTGSALAMAVPLLLSPVLSRLYSPSDFGQAGFYLAIVSALTVVATGKYELPVLITRRDGDALHLAFLVATLLAVALVLSGCAAILWGVFFPLGGIFYSIPLAVVLLGLTILLDQCNNRLRKYYLISTQRLIRSAVEGAVAIALSIFFQLNYGLIIGLLSGYGIAVLVILPISYQAAGVGRVMVSRGRVAFVAKKYLAFPKYSMPHALVNSLSASFPVLLFPLFFSQSVAGLYYFGVRIVQVPLSLLAASICSVLSRDMAEAQAQRGNLLHIFRKRIIYLSSISLLLLPFSLFAPEMFSLVFGPDWASAGEYIQILTPYLMLNFVSAAFAMVPPLYNRQRTALAIELVYASVKALSITLGGVLGSITISLAIFSLGSSIVILSYLCWLYRLVSSSQIVQHDE